MMKRYLSRWGTAAAAAGWLAAGWLAVGGIVACNGELTVLSQPVDVASGADGSSTNTGQSAAASCPELSVAYPVTFASFPQLIECGVCSCQEGEVACSERACQPLQTLGRCPEHFETIPDAHTTRAHIVGDTLYVDAKGHGGCGDVDLLPCFVPPEQSSVASQSDYPRLATIRVLNPTSPADCPKVVFQHFELELRALAVAGFRSEEGGLVNTSLGLLQVGELSCLDTYQLASNQVHQELLRLDAPSDSFVVCESDADCVPGFAVSCSDCVNLPGNLAAQAALVPELERIESSTCTQLAATCRDLPYPSFQGCDGLAARCRNGRCEGTQPP
ncbi:MAG: hypothetical protein RL033_7455 [Pseudomonadota bacterium]